VVRNLRTKAYIISEKYLFHQFLEELVWKRKMKELEKSSILIKKIVPKILKDFSEFQI
jgi:hypothetical protein